MNKLETLQGAWVLISHESKGEKLYEEAIRLHPARLLVAGQRYTVSWNSRVFVDEEFRIDPTASPKRMDLVRVCADGREWVLPGIYSLEDGLLTICLGTNGPDRDPPAPQSILGGLQA